MQTGFIGAGNMAQAIIGGLLNTGTEAGQIAVFDPDTALVEELVATHGLHAARSNTELFENCDIIVLAVKPQVMKTAIENLRTSQPRKGALIVSVAAGTPIDLIQAWLGHAYPVVRVMPNTPALVGAGVSGLYASAQVSPEQRELAESVMRAVGSVIWVSSESLIDSVTAVSGSGPAYFFYFIEALERAALNEGLSAEQARLLSLETAFGAAKLALESEADAATLRRRVTSPGGTTEAALGVLDSHKLADIVAEAVAAASDRARALAAQAGS